MPAAAWILRRQFLIKQSTGSLFIPLPCSIEDGFTLRMTQDYVPKDSVVSGVPAWFAEEPDSCAASEGEASRKGQELFV